MQPLAFVTTNSQKFAKAQAVCDQHTIKLLQQQLDIDEVQSEDTGYVARRKAEAAYVAAGQPVIISDDAWQIHGLGGFPGTYAKSVNEWFTPQDFLRLCAGLQDRRITFTQTLVYQDDNQQKVFERKTVGVVLREARGDSGVSIQAIVSLEPDQTTSIAEVIGTDTHYAGESASLVWHDFAKWYTTKA